MAHRTEAMQKPGAERVIKHRSSQACQPCRSRKVRCDLLANKGSRCTNCKLDRLECVVLASRRGRNNGVRRDSAAKSMGPNQNRSHRSISQAETIDDRQASEESSEAPNTTLRHGQVPVCVNFEEDAAPEVSTQQSTGDASNNGSARTPSSAFNAVRMSSVSSNTIIPQSPDGQPLIPPFVTPLPARIPSEDMEFLARKGAFTIPEPDLCLEIVRGYLFSVHPFMPMLDFEEFTNALINNGEHGHISLLLFQAVMFAGLHSLDPTMINRLGFNSVKEARQVFFARVRLLYDFDVESDGAAVVQSLVLMSLMYSKWDERRHTWYWTGLAYDAARSMGLHREPTTGLPERTRRFRRRLWWSLYIRDRMIALGTRRPMRIPDDEFDVAMLTVEDFEVQAVDITSQGQPLIPNKDENTATALMCIQLARLCICIGHVVASQYTTLTTQTDALATMMVASRYDATSTKEAESCEKEIEHWFQSLSTKVGRESSTSARRDPRSCAEVHWAVLNVTYLTVLNVLHRAQALQPSSGDEEAVSKLPKAKVKDSARSLTKLSQNMLRNDQVRYFGPIGVTALVAACLTHMLDVSSEDEDVRDASTFRLHQSLQVLHALSSIYASADAAVLFLATVTRKAGISLPEEYCHGVSNENRPATKSTSNNGLNGINGLLRVESGARNDQLNGSNMAWSQDHFDQSSRPNHPQMLLNCEPGHFHSTTIQSSSENSHGGRSSAIPFGAPNATMMSFNLLDQRSDVARTSLYEAIPDPVGDGTFYNMHSDMDSGTDFNPFTLNHDFYADAFGFLDGRFQGM